MKALEQCAQLIENLRVINVGASGENDWNSEKARAALHSDRPTFPLVDTVLLGAKHSQPHQESVTLLVVRLPDLAAPSRSAFLQPSGRTTSNPFDAGQKLSLTPGFPGPGRYF
jgi:hypothetical protein